MTPEEQNSVCLRVIDSTLFLTFLKLSFIQLLFLDIWDCLKCNRNLAGAPLLNGRKSCPQCGRVNLLWELLSHTQVAYQLKHPSYDDDGRPSFGF